MLTTLSRMSVVRASISFIFMKPAPLVISRPMKMLRVMLIEGTRAESWKIVSTPSRSVSGRVTFSSGSPSQKYSPDDIATVPDMILTRVDLPAPLSPRRPTTSPLPTEKETSFRTVLGP